MDYSIILAQINSNLLDMINIVSDCKNILEGLFLLFCIYFIYTFIKNLIKSR